MNACEDFFITIGEEAHKAAALTVFGMKSIDALPSNGLFIENSLELDVVQQRKIL